MRDELRKRLQDLGERTAVVHGSDSHTYTELLAKIDEVGAALNARGVEPHEPVIVHGDVSFPSIAVLLALAVRRSVAIPIVDLTPELQVSMVTSCQARRLVRIGSGGDVGITSLSEQPPDRPLAVYGNLVDSGAAGLVLLSSGTTGEPKAILHNFDALIAQKLERRAAKGQSAMSILMMLLFDHIGGVNTLLSSILLGRPTIVPMERTPEEVCRLVENYRVRLLPTSPTFLNLILLGHFHELHDLGSLRLITYGTEPMPAELLRRISTALPRARLLQTFGTSETGISTTVSESSQSTRFKIDDPAVQYRIVDGELQLKTRTQFLGYVNQETTTVTEDGWFRTGDLVEHDPDGYLTIMGRLRDVINVGGEKVLPLELESILLSSPLVEDCAVYGKPNAITGQSVWVDVRTKPGMSKSDSRQHVIQYLGQHVETFKVPTRVNVVDSLGVSDRFKKRRGPA